MKIHYFQRYHSKENVDTANAMLLLSRVYSYSTTKFFAFLSEILPDNSDVEISFDLQVKSESSVPDAVIRQKSFKVAIETKLHGNFGIKQLENHLEAFKGEDYKVLLTIDPGELNKKTEIELYKKIDHFNQEISGSEIIHRHITFENLVESMYSVIDERDYEIMDVLDDYKEYCYKSGLIPDDWKRMRMQLAGTTLAVNKKLNLYYDNVNRGFSGHEYLGLYSQKAVRAIGKINAIVTGLIDASGNLITNTEKGYLTEEMKERILEAIKDSRQYGYNLKDIEHRFFFVDEFIDTCFEKTTLYPPRGSRVFDLTEIIGDEELPSVAEIAEILKSKTWS